jgi:DNA-directed RNA polymerase specialized sigma24 family protein
LTQVVLANNIVAVDAEILAKNIAQCCDNESEIANILQNPIDFISDKEQAPRAIPNKQIADELEQYQRTVSRLVDLHDQDTKYLGQLETAIYELDLARKTIEQLTTEIERLDRKKCSTEQELKTQIEKIENERVEKQRVSQTRETTTSNLFKEIEILQNCLAEKERELIQFQLAFSEKNPSNDLNDALIWWRNLEVDLTPEEQKVVIYCHEFVLDTNTIAKRLNLSVDKVQELANNARLKYSLFLQEKCL